MNYLIVVVVLLVGGCAPFGPPLPHKVEPTALSEKGLLVGEVFGGALTAIKHTDPVYSFFNKGNHVVHIDDSKYNVEFYNDMFMVDLPPGEHEIKGVSQGPNYFTMNHKFSIQAGKVTSIGGLYFLHIQNSNQSGYNYSSSRYKIFQVDNEGLVRDFMRNVRPDIYSALKDKRIYKSSNQFLSGSRLDSLRQVVAMRMAEDKINYSGVNNKKQKPYFVNGPLGVAGWVDVNASNKPLRYRPLPLNTLEQVWKCEVDGKRFGCIVGARRSESYSTVAVLSGSRGGKVRPVELPKDLDLVSLHLFGRDGIAVVDSNYNSYVKTGRKATWKEFQQPGKGTAAGSNFKYVDVDDGYYTYYHDGESFRMKSFLTHTSNRSGEESSIPLPEGFGLECSDILPTSNGLIIGPDFDFFSKSDIYVRSNDGKWTTVKLPQSRCRSLVRNGKNFDDLSVTCKETKLRSVDGGYTWTVVGAAK